MKTKSSLESAFFNARALIGFGFSAIGLLLGLVAFIALPSQSAWASPAPCTEVVFTDSNGPNGTTLVSMESHSEGYPGSPCTIYFTVSSTGWPSNPTHSSTVYTAPFTLPWGGVERWFLAFGHKLNASPEDTDIFEHQATSRGGP